MVQLSLEVSLRPWLLSAYRSGFVGALFSVLAIYVIPFRWAFQFRAVKQKND